MASTTAQGKTGCYGDMLILLVSVSVHRVGASAYNSTYSTLNGTVTLTLTLTHRKLNVTIGRPVFIIGEVISMLAGIVYITAALYPKVHPT